MLASSVTQRDPFRIQQLIERHRITILQATPTALEMLLASGWLDDHSFITIKLFRNGDPNIDVLVGGEPFRASLLPLIGKCRSIRNVYGPTETTIWLSCFLLPRQLPENGKLIVFNYSLATFNNFRTSVDQLHSLSMPIGKPIGNTVFYNVKVEKSVEEAWTEVQEVNYLLQFRICYTEGRGRGVVDRRGWGCKRISTCS